MRTTRFIYEKIGNKIVINNSVEIQSTTQPNNDAAIQLFQEKLQDPHLPEDIKSFFKQQIQKLQNGADYNYAEQLFKNHPQFEIQKTANGFEIESKHSTKPSLYTNQ